MQEGLKLGAQAVALATVAALGTLLVWRLVHPTPPPRVGSPAPLFALRRLQGDGKVSLASLRGKTVVLNFWASWCGPCKREAPTLEQVWRDYRSRGVVVLGVYSGDEAGDARRFLSAHGITYPIVSDSSENVGFGLYGIPGYPVTVVINPLGRVVGGEILGPVSESAHSQSLYADIHAALAS